jgi:hypothetical protein
MRSLTRPLCEVVIIMALATTPLFVQNLFSCMPLMASQRVCSTIGAVVEFVFFPFVFVALFFSPFTQSLLPLVIGIAAQSLVIWGIYRWVAVLWRRRHEEPKI